MQSPSGGVQLVGFALRVSDLPQGLLHPDILTNNVQDALAKPSSANWAAQVVKHVRSLGLPAPLAPDGTVLISSLHRHERENFTSPFSQHWLTRTRLCWSHQPH